MKFKTPLNISGILNLFRFSSNGNRSFFHKLKFPGSPSFLNFAGLLMVSVLVLSCHSHEEGHHDDDHDEEDHHEAAGVRLDHHQAEEFGIETETVKASTFHHVIRTTGEIGVSTGDVYTVTARKSGIVSVNPKVNQGSSVNSGESIASITSAGIQGGDADEIARANLHAAEKEYQRLKPLYEDGLVTASTFHEAERAYNEAKAISAKNSGGVKSAATSPIAGVVTDLYVKSGEYVDVGSPIATVMKNNRQTLKADLPAREASHLKDIVSANVRLSGNQQTVSLRNLDGVKVSGSQQGSQNGYIPVFFNFNATQETSHGGYVEVFLICGERNDVITIPRDGLIELQGNHYAYVETGHDTYEKRRVTIGGSDGERVEVKEGLAPGEEVVTKGASVVRMAEISAVAPPAHTHNH